MHFLTSAWTAWTRPGKLARNSAGLAIASFFTEEMTAVGTGSRDVLAAPFRFVVEDGAGASIPFQNSLLRFTKLASGEAAWEVTT